MASDVRGAHGAARNGRLHIDKCAQVWTILQPQLCTSLYVLVVVTECIGVDRIVAAAWYVPVDANQSASVASQVACVRDRTDLANLFQIKDLIN